MKHNKYSKLRIPECPMCGEEMVLDDIDYYFDGKQDNYFICKNDNTSCYQNVRYGNVSFEDIIKGERK